jgi:hypothetical protein
VLDGCWLNDTAHASARTTRSSLDLRQLLLRGGVDSVKGGGGLDGFTVDEVGNHVLVRLVS